MITIALVALFAVIAIFCIGKVVGRFLFTLQLNRAQRGMCLPPPESDERDWQHRFEKEHRA